MQTIYKKIYKEGNKGETQRDSPVTYVRSHHSLSSFLPIHLLRTSVPPSSSSSSSSSSFFFLYCLVVIDGVVHSNVRFFSLSPQWPAQTKNFPIAVFGQPKLERGGSLPERAGSTAETLPRQGSFSESRARKNSVDNLRHARTSISQPRPQTPDAQMPVQPSDQDTPSQQPPPAQSQQPTPQQPPPANQSSEL